MTVKKTTDTTDVKDESPEQTPAEHPNPTYTRDQAHPGLSEQQLVQLMQPISPGRVANRSQGGANLSYVEAYDIKATLTRIFGFGGFSAEVLDARTLDVITAETHPYHVKADKKAKTPQVTAVSTVRLTIHATGAVYTETAIGSNSGWDIGDAADNAIKSAASDALKRAATYLGSQFGLSLYKKGSQEEVVRVVLQDEQAGQLQDYSKRRKAREEEYQRQANEKLQTATGNVDTLTGEVTEPVLPGKNEDQK